MIRGLRLIAALAAAGLLGAAAVVTFGLYNVSAQVGHWPGVSWVLHETFRNSVRLRAPAPAEVPDLSDPALVRLGERHYASACSPCHAAPGVERTATMRAMVPQPPHLADAVEQWAPEELHWIIQNGIKMSGMPAWPARHRGDEVWAVVAYLVAVRQGRAPPAAKEDGCGGCHGTVARHVPRLDIHTEAYLAKALRDFIAGTRASGIMQQAVSGMTPEEADEIAGRLAASPVVPGGAAASAPAEGEALARRGTGDVPACAACHGPGASRARPGTPALAGQGRAYLAAQLRLWRAGHRGGSEVMAAAARRLTDDQIDALAAWYAALPPAKGPG
ncbi:MAG: c-type cytochrome [Rhodobacteraceae bacterium]|jgi:cytochrome c553|nr:c-type cytochrome [Paracoccaceae bacterium]